ncbi:MULTISPECIES: WG repeat-containing protein [Butyricimonas]|uniref:WG repeat-containing protein n=1 Tax=Butyricimonas TaxID=574697 RepID=UPI0007FB53FA|nr:MULTISPECIES: WG repeat-containing protein [Butyricimonas]
MMRIGIILFTCVLLFASCDEKRIAIYGLPLKITRGDEWGILGTDGTVKMINAFKYQPSAVVNGRLSVPDDSGKYELYGFEGELKLMSPKKFAAIGYFFENVTFAQEEVGEPLLLVDKHGEKVAVVDNYEGHKILLTRNFREGLALVYTSNGKYGYVDTRGEMVIKPVYDYAADFSEGLAVVGVAGGEGQLAYRVIDKRGEIQFYITLQNSRIHEHFSCGYLLFKNLEQNYCGALDRGGKVCLYLPTRIQEVMPFRYDAAVFWTETGVGLINKEGKVLIPANYDDGKIVGERRVALKLRDKWGLFDFEGRPLCEFVYDWISDFEGYAFACRDHVYYIMDERGQVVGPNKFSTVLWDRVAAGVCPQVFTLHEMVKDSIVEPVEREMKTERLEEPVQPKVRTIDRNSPFYREARQVMDGGLQEEDASNRQVILNYMEHFRMSYLTKDIDFLEQLFSEEALIVVGTVVKRAAVGEVRYLSPEQVRYSVKSKREYLNRLRVIFQANQRVDVNFTDFSIKRHPTKVGIYGVSVKQNYRSDMYSDQGYLFLLWDFRDETAPKIHVRTWQPRMLDERTPLPEQEIFNIGSFNLE